MMEKAILELQKHWNKLSQRESVAVIAGLVAALFILWNVVIYEPYKQNVILLDMDIKQTQAKIVGVRTKLMMLQAEMKKDPDSENKKLLAEYIEEGKRLDGELAKASVQIIDVRDVVALLKQMLEKQSKLKFVSLENKQAIPEFIEKGQQTEAATQVEDAITIYRHSVMLKMEGNYSSVLSYLQALEKLPWQFFWQSFDIETEKYPNALITLEVYTLGLREGMIGV